ncbi:hypothetical protein PRVXH_001274 [Proteinivorax hydrogeniformans]|uniref:Uncharacterized protein n=1 Tax=Proteinivorax hydrogeniformans TaxID=1826727 RepID=A0AAU8HX32_9FIRM
MSKDKCPECGSSDTVEIVYGKPTSEAFEAANRGEIVLGGCCEPLNGPSRKCKNCGSLIEG